MIMICWKMCDENEGALRTIFESVTRLESKKSIHKRKFLQNLVRDWELERLK